jgi:predicted acetyltransferase
MICPSSMTATIGYDRGLWEPNYLPSCLEKDADHPLTIFESGKRVGCAQMNQAPSAHMRHGTDFRMSEFFVLRKHRRGGIGSRAVFALFDRFSGKWKTVSPLTSWPVVPDLCPTRAYSSERAGRFM